MCYKAGGFKVFRLEREVVERRQRVRGCLVFVCVGFRGRMGGFVVW